MMNHLICTSVLLSIYLIYNRGSRIHVETKTGRRYLVKPITSKQSAKLLDLLNIKKNQLCDYLQKQKKYKNHKGVQQLLQNRKVIIEEASKKYKGEAAYSINKGERIGICLRNKKGQYEENNTMFFVLIHELAHIMTSEYKHNEKFWNNMALLIKNAIEADLYEYIEYKKYPEMYCGHKISHSPYTKNI